MAFALFAENTAITPCQSGAYLGFFYLTSYKLGRGSLVSLFVWWERFLLFLLKNSWDTQKVRAFSWYVS